MSAYPDDNPKTITSVTKVPLHLVPPSAKHYLAMAMANGAAKYGPYNWRERTVSVSIYKAAAVRHLDAFWDGEELAEDSGVHHLAHAMACMAILLDARTLGKLNDDRPLKGCSPELQREYAGTLASEEAPYGHNLADALKKHEGKPLGIIPPRSWINNASAHGVPPGGCIPCSMHGDGS